MYTEFIHPQKNQVTAIIRELDNAFIPIDPANSDYQAYLKYLEENN